MSKLTIIAVVNATFFVTLTAASLLALYPSFHAQGDADGNGVVDYEDITSVLSHWGGVNPNPPAVCLPITRVDVLGSDADPLVRLWVLQEDGTERVLVFWGVGDPEAWLASWGLLGLLESLPIWWSPEATDTATSSLQTWGILELLESLPIWWSREGKDE